MGILLNRTYSIIAEDELSFIITSVGGSGKVIFPKELVYESLSLCERGVISLDMGPREIREIVKVHSEWASHIINMETHLKALLVFFSENNKLDIKSRIGHKKTINQQIIYGAPGTGKSHYIEEQTQGIPHINRFRTVFHPETTHTDLFGSFQPKTKIRPQIVQQSHDFVQNAEIRYTPEQSPTANAQSSQIVYEFVPGPLMRAVKSAVHNLEQQHVLIIEEINRAHAAAVFGEVFQLLDRAPSGWSKYPITISEAASDYLDFSNPELEDGTLKLPPNLSIYATMNTADQGVYPMDTAFKRRWSFKYIPLDGLDRETWNADNWNPPIVILNGVRWQSFRQGVNSYIHSQSKSGTLEIPIPEDKLIGPYFLSERELSGDLQGAIIEKVFFYLLFDVLKYSPNVLFNEPLTMSEIRQKAIDGTLWGALNAQLKQQIQSFNLPISEPSQSENAE